MSELNLSANYLKGLPKSQLARLLNDLTAEEAAVLFYNWSFWARPKQILPDGDWRIWLILAGRGFGKTRTGAEAVRIFKEGCPRIAIVAPTIADARDICIEGESGLKVCCVPGELTTWNRSLGEFEFSNGARGKCFSAEEPDRLNGPQHYAAWCDELGVWKYPRQTWDMLMMGLRQGRAQCVITTTPKRQYPKSRELIKEIRSRPSTRVTVGTSGENRDNLSEAWWNEVVAPYEGTELGRQEIGAEVLDDVTGALWNRQLLDRTRVTQAPQLTRIVVAVDPEATATETSAETGIVVAGIGTDKHGYVLDDRTIKGSPHVWGSQAVAAYHSRKADRIIYEANQGGDMVAHTLQTVDRTVPLKAVHASRGKQARAEPIAALYEQGKVHHVGVFTALEDECCNWTPNSGQASPDRLDALVWALSELMLGAQTFVMVGGKRIG